MLVLCFIFPSKFKAKWGWWWWCCPKETTLCHNTTPSYSSLVLHKFCCFYVVVVCTLPGCTFCIRPNVSFKTPPGLFLPSLTPAAAVPPRPPPPRPTLPPPIASFAFSSPYTSTRSSYVAPPSQTCPSLSSPLSPPTQTPPFPTSTHSSLLYRTSQNAT